jgi:hypothetical protein
MIEYPDDGTTEEQAEKHGIPAPVLVRDLVRIVEVMNLDEQGFFSQESVLSGSMALRCFNSPRFTVYDADFATAIEAQPGRTEMRDMLRYADDDLEIVPSDLTPHDAKGTAWKSAPIRYVPAFTTLAPEETREFKADISSRGLVLPGLEQEILVPYDLGIWTEPPTVWIMDPHEIVAEKTLGWILHREVKHYADLAFIAIGTQPEIGPLFNFNKATLRDTLAEKLEIMRTIQPDYYAPWATVNDVIESLDEDPVFDQREWEKIVYLRAQRDRFGPALLKKAVQTLLVPLLK